MDHSDATSDALTALGYTSHELGSWTGADGDARTVLRRHPDVAARGPLGGRDVIYVPGWNDYFFQTHVADHVAGLGARFWALEYQGGSPGAAMPLDRMWAALDVALDVIRPREPVIGAGHSLGGLGVTLWAARHGSRVGGLVLDSPWLEFQGGAAVRRLLTPLLDRGLVPMPRSFSAVYAHSLHRRWGGEWDWDLARKPARGQPLSDRYLAEVFAAQERVARGPDLRVPVLVLCSAVSRPAVRRHAWTGRVDTVLWLRPVIRRARGLGRDVTVARLDGAPHDVFLGAPDVRARAFGVLDRWVAERFGDGRFGDERFRDERVETGEEKL